MRWCPSLLSFALTLAPGVGFAQEDAPATEGGNYLDYGGVRVPLPDETPSEAPTLSPTPPPAQTAQEPAESVQGRQSGREETDAEGNTRQVWQNTRVSGVEQSTSRDRFNWFYDAPEVYQGVIPHVRDSLPHISTHQERGERPRERNQVTWIGFQPLPDRTRVFIQVAREPSWAVTEQDGGLTLSVELDNTRLSLSNFARFLDTSFFERSVQMIDAEELPGQRTRIVIWRAESAPYTVTLDGDYLLIDFQDVGRRR